jgi:fermentation-respiration switch protein FrsA (DUF1100 family)
MPMRYRCLAAVVIIAALTAALAAMFWRQRQLASALHRQSAEVAALLQQLETERQEFIAQRERSRRQTLDTTVRTPDEFLALFPAKYPQGDWQPAESVFEDCWFRSADGLRLHGWLLHHDQPRHVMLLLHGNAGNVTHRAAISEYLSKRYAASVFVFDYRGYGRSEGTPTIPGLLDDARAARALLAQRERVREQDIILLGESLGGAIAVDLAARDGARALVLQSTFSSLKEVAAVHYPPILVDVLVADRLDSAAQIASYRGPLLQVHGEADRTIPIALGRKLFAAAGEPKTLLALPGHDHNDRLPESFFLALDDLLHGLPDPPD